MSILMPSNGFVFFVFKTTYLPDEATMKNYYFDFIFGIGYYDLKCNKIYNSSVIIFT